MPWFKVDDGLALHPKAIIAGNAAMGLWIRAGAWSAQQLTDGHIPRSMVRVIGTAAEAKRLVAAGLWIPIEDGYAFHEWEKYQPSRADVTANRASNVRRQALSRDVELREAIRLRDDDHCRYCGQRVVWKDRRGTAGGTYDHIDPTGENTLDNLVVACRGCNSRKGGRTPRQAGMKVLKPRTELGEI